MKFLLLASFVLFCTASTVYRSRNISVNDDGNIVITSPSGRQVVISRDLGPSGQKNIDIAISGPNIPTKRIQVNDNTLEEGIGYGNEQWSSIDSLSEESRLKRGSAKGKSQGDILAEILREYQGVVDEAQYEKLLNRINKAARRGEVSPQVYDLLEGLDQQQGQQQGIGAQGTVLGQYGQQVQGQGQLYGLRYGYEAVPYTTSYPQGQSQVYQSPIGSYLYSQYLGYTPNANPLLQGLSPITKGSYYYGLLANQQLSSGVQSVLNRLGYQTVPQTILSRYQQVPYGQSQVAALPYVQQTIAQLTGTGFQQQQQLSEVEQTIEQLVQVQEQIQQQQQIAQQYFVQQAIQELVQVQQQQQQVGQTTGVQLTIQAVQFLTQIQQQLQQQQWTGLLPRIQQAIQVIEQLYELQQQVPQQVQIGQLTELRQVIQQLYEIQQLQQQQQQIAQLFQQLVQIQQQQDISVLSGLRQPLVQLYQQQQQIAQLIAELNQIQQQQQGFGQLAGLRQSLVQLYGQQQQVIAQLVQQLSQIQQHQGIFGLRGLATVQQQQYGYRSGLFAPQQQQYGYRSGPLTLQQLIGTQQSGRVGSYQPIYRGYGYVQPSYVQGRSSSYFNTIPQVQVVY